VGWDSVPTERRGRSHYASGGNKNGAKTSDEKGRFLWKTISINVQNFSPTGIGHERVLGRGKTVEVKVVQEIQVFNQGVATVPLL